MYEFLARTFKISVVLKTALFISFPLTRLNWSYLTVNR